MRKFLVVMLVLIVVCAAGAGWAFWLFNTRDAREPSRVAYAAQCASCHSGDLQGTSSGPALVDVELSGGDDAGALTASITTRHSEDTTAHLRENLSDTMIKAVALFVSERRQHFPTTASSFNALSLEQKVDSRYYRLRSELVTRLAGNPYSIAALPDGRFLVVEKSLGLSIVDTHGKQSSYIAGTPKAWPATITVQGMQIALGIMLDVALHPGYRNNGWIYLSHSDRCQLDCGSLWPVAMVRVIRGRIKDGQWVDEETVWSVAHDHYTVTPDSVSGGRLAFDHQGHLYITVGGRWTYDNLHDMNTPYGKVHRVRDDGTVPQDNPFWEPDDRREASSTRHTVWSYGHRTIQGLAAHSITGEIWGSEMGPRGGDEVNRIERGGNYGWPLYTGGLDYDAEPITIGKDLGLNFPIEETILPVVDFTPAPAISNLTFHHGGQFTAWRDDILVGSLKAQTLYRLRIEDGALQETEKIVTNVGRIRDVEMGADGFVYLAVEHADGGALVRIRPD